MRDVSDKSIKTAFDSYHRQRYLEADEIIKGSNIVTKIMFGHSGTTHRLTPDD
ncbi:hypothetical protein BGX26_004725 [Mortierella sp. AD094]|nr:hypothetical protein BGX26_004725 [Mortierella sp. AD094]